MPSPLSRLIVLILGALALLAVPSGASAIPDAVATYTYTQNMHPLGHSARNVPLTGAGSGIYNSDLAFWGKRAYQGTYSGFRIVDVSDPENPVELKNYEE